MAYEQGSTLIKAIESGITCMARLVCMMWKVYYYNASRKVGEAKPVSA